MCAVHLVCFLEHFTESHRMSGIGRDLKRSDQSEAGTPRLGHTGMHPDGFWMSPEKETP